ncbi:hypothetical protein AAFF_G00097970 [Aldrovandia affinis]|uniref:Uncharacterized protein n=1 Tax=Aldrovandia affinis TaxID=143900 RepID=A0AAD7WCM0_9TELE|nr:hypothetical protein AAFF_G00097970 [Aldrovandia affinis]
MGFGPQFSGWVCTLYALPGERVPERGGGAGWGVASSPCCSTSCSSSPLLGWCAETRVSTVFGSRGAAGEVLKIQQYADNTMLFVSSVQSLGRIRALTDLFGAGTGSGVRVREMELMYAPVVGGWGVQVPLKLDVLYASFVSKVFLERVLHKCFFLARYYLAGFFRHLVVLTHVVPRAAVRSPAYEVI